MSGRPTLEEVRGWPATVGIREAARVFGVSPGTAYALVQRGEFPTKVLRLGRRWVIPTAALIRLLEDEDE